MFYGHANKAQVLLLLLFASAMEASNNSSKIQEADRAMENANRAIETVSERINQLKTGKSQIRLVFLAGLAIRMLGKNHLVVAIIEELLPINLLTNVLPIAGRRAFSKASTKVASEAAGNAFAKGAEGGSKTAGKAGAQRGAKAAGSFIVGVNAVFLILDVADLAFTVRDIVKNKGSDAARYLRAKADEYEVVLNRQ